MPMNPFSSIARFVRGPMFGRAAPIAAGAGLGATVPDAIGAGVGAHNDRIRDETARDIIGGIMDAQQQEAVEQAQQEAIYMQGAEDAASMLMAPPSPEDYSDYLGSGDGMYSLAAAMITPKAVEAKGPAAAAGLPAPKPAAAAKPSVVKLGSAGPAQASAVLADVPGVLADALGIHKASMSPAAIGAAIGGGVGISQGRGSERVRNALLGAAIGAGGGHVAGNPTTRSRLAGMFEGAAS